MKWSTTSSVLGTVVGLFMAGLLLCYVIDINFWWALAFAAVGLLGPIFPIFDFGSSDDASSSFDA
jgi:hypothetical protein